MTEPSKDHRPDWPTLVQALKREVAALGDVEQAWLNERLAMIAVTQQALDQLFCKAGGSTSCSGCDGACCGCGRHHITLTNLLAYLLAGEEPPVPNFSRTCPFLGETGCRLPVPRRPYNCITFFCEILEDQLSPDECEQLRSLDRRLRNEYQRVAQRYPGASLRGLWIALEQVGLEHLLSAAEKDVLE